MAVNWTPRPWQREIITHQAAVNRNNTWAQMGSGKTAATLATISGHQCFGGGPALVIAPLRVARTVWGDEARKWAELNHLDVVPILGTVAERRAAMRRDAAVHTINYENIPWLISEGYWVWDFVVADESTRLRGFRLRQGAARPRALGRVAHHPKIKRWVNLTGTPSPQGLADLWGQQWFVDKGQRLGRTFSAFQQRWFTVGYDGYSVSPLPTANDEIKDRLRDCSLTIMGLAAREPIVHEIVVPLPDKARRKYDAMEKDFFLTLSAGLHVDAANAAVKSGKLLQLANGAIYHDDGKWTEVHDAKIEALESLVYETAGAPLLVVYNFQHDLARLQKAFPKARTLNNKTMHDWNRGEVPMLLVHPASAGHGLSLQDGGNIIVFFGVNWNLEEHDQVIERIGPMRQQQAGHDRPVYVYYLLSEDTIDATVIQRLRTKRSVQDVLLEAMLARSR